jgi:hypothetical protein
MSTIRLELDFDANAPVARIYVKRSWPIAGDPNTYLTKDCAFERELSEAIDSLHAELEELRVKGQRQFAAERRSSSGRV